MTWIQTFSGKKFSLTDPQPEDVRIEDVAAALTQIVRFNGHCRGPYSVAQHSLHVAELVLEELRYDALLHDAPEAYYGDLTRPLKAALNWASQGMIKCVLERIDRVVFEALGVSRADDRRIKFADDTMLATEARDLMLPPLPLERLPAARKEALAVLPASEVHERFLAAYHEFRPTTANVLNPRSQDETAT